MPTISFTATQEGAARIVAALEAINFERTDGEADMDYVKRFVRLKVNGVVHDAEVNAAMAAIPVPDGVIQ